MDISELQERYRDGNKLYFVQNEDRPFSGTADGYYDDGQLKQSMEISSGLLDGELASFDRNGQKSEVWSYDDGQKDGEFCLYDSKERPSMEGSYDDGHLDGTLKRYIDGQLVQEMELDKGNCAAVSMIFSKGHTLKMKFPSKSVSVEGETANLGKIGQQLTMLVMENLFGGGGTDAISISSLSINQPAAGDAKASMILEDGAGKTLREGKYELQKVVKIYTALYAMQRMENGLNQMVDLASMMGGNTSNVEKLNIGEALSGMFDELDKK